MDGDLKDGEGEVGDIMELDMSDLPQLPMQVNRERAARVF